MVKEGERVAACKSDLVVNALLRSALLQHRDVLVHVRYHLPPYIPTITRIPSQLSPASHSNYHPHPIQTITRIPSQLSPASHLYYHLHAIPTLNSVCMPSQLSSTWHPNYLQLIKLSPAYNPI